MKPEFRDRHLGQLETEDAGTKYHPSIVKAFRRRMQQIRAAVDERDFHAQRSLRFEKLKGSRGHQCSMRLNDQWRLVLELEDRETERVVVIVGIEDYH